MAYKTQYNADGTTTYSYVPDDINANDPYAAGRLEAAAKAKLQYQPSAADPVTGAQTLTPIVPKSPVVSSTDNQQQFGTDSDSLAKQQEALRLANEKKAADAGKTKTDAQISLDQNGQQTGDTRTPPAKTGDTALDSYSTAVAGAQAKADQANATAEQQRADRMLLYNTSLAAIDQTVASTINNINNTYSLRIAEQKRINALNVDRVKAYGLAGGGRFTPISFNDAISVKEEEAANRVTELENTRNSLIAQAQAARDEGASKLLRQRMEDIDNVNQQLQTSLNAAQKAADDQYKLLRDIRQEEETKHKELVAKQEKQFLAFADAAVSEYDSKSDKDKVEYIKKLAQEQGVDFTYAYSALEAASKKAKTTALDTEQKKATIANTKATTAEHYATAASKKKQSDMDQNVPATFTDDKDFYAKRADFVKKYGVEGANYWDKVFVKDAVGDPQYTKAAAGDKSKAGKTGKLKDGRAFIVAEDGETLLDPKTKQPLK